MKARFLLLSSFVVASACTAVGPDYERPEPEITDHFHGTEFSEVAEEALSSTWWTTFDDPLLDELVREAIEANHDIAIARANVRRARAIHRITDARRLPTLDLDAGYARVRSSENGVVNLGALSDAGIANLETDLFDVGLDAAWEIDVFGSVRRANESTLADFGATIEGARATALSVIAEVASTYLELRGSERRLAAVQRNVDTQARTLELVQNKFDTGLTPELDLRRAEAQLEGTRASLSPLETAIQSALFRLAVLTDRQPGELHETLRGTAALPIRGEPVPVGLPSELLRRRPDVRAAERSLAARTADVGVAVADLYPRFFLSGSAGFESVDFSDLFETSSGTFQIGPRIQWPLFRGGELRARVDAAEADLEAEHQRFRQTLLVAVEDVERSLTAYAQSERQRRTLTRARDASRRSVELANALYENGLSDFLDLLDAERRLQEAEDVLASAETDVSLQLVGLYKALGGGWEEIEILPPDDGDE